MTERKCASGFLRRARPWLIAFGAFSSAIRVGGLLLSRRLDAGDETAGELRRLRTMGRVSLKPVSQELLHLRFDLVLAGVELDLRQAHPAPGGIDVTVNCALAGGEIKVPAGWRLFVDGRGAGGVTLRNTNEAVGSATNADLRLHVRALMGGVTITN